MKKSSKSDMNTLDRCIEGICNGNDRARTEFNIIVEERCCPEVDAIKSLSDQVKFGLKMQTYALKELTQAADKGNMHALAVVAYMHIYSIGVKNSTANIKKGLEQLKNSNMIENAFASYYLGCCYLNGVGKQLEADMPNAIKYFEKAANLGCSMSLFRLGRMYENGRGFERNQVTAEKYYRLAAEKGSPNGLYQLSIKGDLPKISPYYFYMPKNLDLICQIGANKLAKVEGNVYNVQTTHVTNSLFVSIIYTGNLPIDKNITETKLTGLNGFPLDRSEWDVQMFTYYRGGVKFSAGDRDDKDKLYNYQLALVLADLIHKADDIITDRISAYQQQQSSVRPVVNHGQIASNSNVTGLPGFFSASQQNQSQAAPNFVNNVNMPVAVPIAPLDPGTTLEIMQMLQNNPQFATQVAQLFHQYKAYYASQMK